MTYERAVKLMYPEFPEACDLTLESPPLFEKVIVIGVGFRTVGYVDKKGRWRQHFDHSVLENVLDWYSLK